MTITDLLDATPAHGAKASTLAALANGGFPVPAGLVVTGDVDAETLDEVVATRLGSGPYAVRSSALDEDGPESSNAGRYRSRLGVDADDVADGVLECRRFAAGVSDASDPIPVVVQQMVDARAAGVVFTADPTTGDRSTVVVSAVAGLGDRLMSGAVSGDEWEVIGRRVTRRRRGAEVLRRRLVRQIAGLARRIAEVRGAPQDIEWAWDGRQVWILQARPITGLPPEASWETEHDGVFHRGFRMGEWIPDPVTPLFENWLLSTMERRLHAIHREVIGQKAPEPLHVVVNGWYFYSMNFLPVPGGSLFRSLPRVLSLAVKNWRRVAVMFPQTAITGYPLYEADWRDDIEPRYRAAVASAERRLDAASSEELVDIIDELADLAGEYFASIAVVAGSGYKVETSFAQFWNRHLKEETGLSHMEVLGGLHGPATAAGGPLLASLDWVVEPTIWHAPPSEQTAVTRRRIRAETEARTLLAGSRRASRRFERLLAHTQHLQTVREEQMAGLAAAWPVMRRSVLRLGGHLAAIGALAEADDVFYLTRAELLDALTDPTELRRVVEIRRKERDHARQLVPPEFVGRMPLMTRVAFEITRRSFGAGATPDALVSGVPASPGTASGPVRLVLDPSAFDTVQRGDVIVAPLTAPAWTPLFERAAALVTDVGSGLAHASIMAREFGIPAVVGCGDATSRLSDGQWVTVDGSTGVVSPGAAERTPRPPDRPARFGDAQP